MSDTITIRTNRVAGYRPGEEVEVPVDDRGNVLDPFWYRRLRDAKRDQCCEVVVHHGTVEPEPEAEAWDEEPE